MTYRRRMLLKWARTFHVYLAMLGLLLLLFFAVTGFMLNHEEWFGPYESQKDATEGTMDEKLLEGPLDKLAIVEKLRGQFGATGALESFENEEDTSRIIVIFRDRNRRTEAIIERPDGRTEVTAESWGLTSRLTDLHRGKRSGATWAYLIDGVSIVLMILAVTGLIMWTSLRTRRQLGVAALAIGVTVGVTLYVVFVP